MSGRTTRTRWQALAFALTAVTIAVILVAGPAFAGVVLTDSYVQSNYSNAAQIRTGSWRSAGQSFTADHNGTLDSAQFYLAKVGSPTGNAYAKLYAHTGTYGTSSVGTGTALATSAALDVSTIGSTRALYTLTFDNTVSLTAGTYYVIVLEYVGGDASNYVSMGADTTSPTHDGNFIAVSATTGNWNYNAGDAIFYVTITPPSPYLTYLDAAAAGDEPFVFLKADGTALTLADGAEHVVGGYDTDMTVPDDFPLGTYTFTGTVADAAGKTTPVTLKLIVAGDREAPVVTVTGVEDDGYYDAPVTPTVTVAGGTLTSLTLNDAPFESGTEVIAEGAYTLVASASDDAGNTTQVTVDFTIDTTAPVVTITGATADGADMAGTLEDGFTLPTTNIPTIDHLLQLKEGSGVSEPLAQTYSGLYLVPEAGQTAALQAYYATRDMGVGDPVVTDSYPESNYSSASQLHTGSWRSAGQSFTADHNGTLDSVQFYLAKTGSPTGNAYAKLYAHTGIYGTSSVGTGTALATSAPLDVSTIGSTRALYTLTFDNTVSLTSGTYYVIVLEYVGGDAGNYVSIGADTTSPTHDGNFIAVSATTGNWNYNAGDAIFYVYVTVDTDAPVIAANVSEGTSYPAPLTVTFSANDAVEGPVAATATLSKDGGPPAGFTSGSTISDAGDYTLVITASDSVPNTATETIHFSVYVPDTEGPVIIVDSLSEGGSYVAPKTITFSASDAVEGPVAATATLNGSPFSSGSAVSSPGSYTLIVTASDSVPNTTEVTIHFDVTEPPVATGTLQGTVTDAVTGLPLSGVTVNAGAAGTIETGAGGTYGFTDVPVGSYSVAVSKSGYLGQSAPGVVVADGATTVQDFALTPAPAVVSTPASSAWSVSLGVLMAGGVLLGLERRRRSA